jgi:hypothetical protein
MKTRALVVLLFCAICAQAGLSTSPPLNKVVIEGNVYNVPDVHFRIVDSLMIVCETPGGTYVVWELPDPEAPDPAVPEKYAMRTAIYWELQKAISQSYRQGRRAELDAIAEVVKRHPELKKVEPTVFDGRVLDSYEVWWRDFVDGEWVDDPDPEQWRCTRGDLLTDPRQGWRATRASAFKQLELFCDATVQQLEEGKLVIIFGNRLQPPLVKVFPASSAGEVLEELELARQNPDAELHFLSPEVAARFRR